MKTLRYREKFEIVMTKWGNWELVTDTEQIWSIKWIPDYGNGRFVHNWYDQQKQSTLRHVQKENIRTLGSVLQLKLLSYIKYKSDPSGDHDLAISRFQAGLLTDQASDEIIVVQSDLQCWIQLLTSQDSRIVFTRENALGGPSDTTFTDFISDIRNEIIAKFKNSVPFDY